MHFNEKLLDIIEELWQNLGGEMAIETYTF